MGFGAELAPTKHSCIIDNGVRISIVTRTKLRYAAQHDGLEDAPAYVNAGHTVILHLFGDQSSNSIFGAEWSSTAT